ncbi:hypothetical protein P2H44_18865 [Albimonas sp. CAU 1670]|uniref:hypothetical protein n=1 Tax=Albimonas sp. CAU 1670 TaxID=3032599 RepID=UPI0023DBB56A|nr:hypothetical protein [Albimonas sp. CAU 1670]MDF2234626.1 hypothetical protein [Albimonas sp. CAU 1670]
METRLPQLLDLARALMTRGEGRARATAAHVGAPDQPGGWTYAAERRADGLRAVAWSDRLAEARARAAAQAATKIGEGVEDAEAAASEGLADAEAPPALPEVSDFAAAGADPSGARRPEPASASAMGVQPTQSPNDLAPEPGPAAPPPKGDDARLQSEKLAEDPVPFRLASRAAAMVIGPAFGRGVIEVAPGQAFALAFAEARAADLCAVDIAAEGEEMRLSLADGRAVRLRGLDRSGRVTLSLGGAEIELAPGAGPAAVDARI